MPANLPPQYFEAEKEYKNARTIPEKIAALEAMMAIMPHHKGTDKLRAGLTRKIAGLRQKAEFQAKTRRGSVFSIDKQGAAQMILIGLPNSGKSSLLAALTKATPDVAEYPFTTSMPVIGMMPYEDIQIQIVDLPPVSGEVRKLPYYNLLRTADALLVVLDGSGDPGVDLCLLLEEMEAGKIFSPLVRTGKLPVGGVRKSVLVAVTRCDETDPAGAVEKVRGAVGGEIPVAVVSARSGAGIPELKEAIFSVAAILRVYTKIPGKKPDLGSPFVLSAGSTVMDLAREIHHDFSDNLRYARVWGSARFEGQSVQRDYVLQDGDIIELHI